MIESQEKLARRLLYLPLDLGEKVLLWLVYRDLKPVSEITVERRNFFLLRRGIHDTSYDNDAPKIRRIREWIHDAGLVYAFDPKYPGSWHVGKDKDKVALSAKILRLFDYESEYKTGILFGYPEESVKAYARNREIGVEKNQIIMVWPGLQVFHPYLKDKYFTPYIFYSIRADRVEEDSQIAKTWADTIRKEVPTLAKWYEKYVTDRRKQEGKSGDVWEVRLRRREQTAAEIVDEYSKEVKTTKEKLQKALREFSDSCLTDVQMASVCQELRQRMMEEEKKDKDLVEKLKKGESMCGRKGIENLVL